VQHDGELRLTYLGPLCDAHLCMRQRAKKVSTALAAVLAPLALVACAKVPKPASDATPPEKVWWSIVDTGAPVEIIGNGWYSVPASRSITITFHGKDSQGLQKISLSNSVGWKCTSGTIVQQGGPGLSAPNTATFAPDAHNMVPVEGVRVATVSGPYSCSSGFTFATGSAGLTGKATNWSNQTTTASLTITITP
jgi:hypothetical protein